MEYYLLPIQEDEAITVDDALRNVGYDLDDRASTWTQDDIDKVINRMTTENATKMIIDFLPDPIAKKFSDLFGIKP